MCHITRARRLGAALLCTGALALPGVAHAQAVPYATARNYAEPSLVPPEHPVDMLRMRLAVSFVPERGLVRGSVTHIFTPLRSQVDSLFFNGPGIRILRAVLNERPVPFTVAPEGVTVHPPQPLRWDAVDSIRFEYEATPRRGIYFIGWNDTTGRRRRQVWTQGQGIDHRNWIPCYDQLNDTPTTETIITFDSSYQVLSNGDLLSVRPGTGGTKVWHYAMSKPHSLYLLMIGIGKYGIETRHTAAGVPVHLYYYPEFPDRVGPTYLYATECMDFVARETGVPFPWSSYANIPVEDYLYGAMENTTATVFGDFFLVDRRAFHDRNYIAVDVHELTHQWFGDLVTAREPTMAWLQESFATFYPKLFLRTVYGDDYYQWMRRGEQNAALAASEQNRLPIIHSQAGSARVYQKGSAVLDMMAYVFGEDAYRRVITHYLRSHAYGLAETNDLYHSFQDVLGLSPAWFFEEWLYRGGEPHYAVSYREVAVEPGRQRQTEVTIAQVHAMDDLVGPFTMPVVIDVHYADGTRDSVRQVLRERTERVTIPNRSGRRIAFVLFDPGSMILKKVTFRKSLEELREQALHAPLMIDRYDAVAALRDTALAAKRSLLLQVYDREQFQYIKAEIAGQLAADSDRSVLPLLKKALHDRDVEVRSSVLEHMPAVPPELMADAEGLLRDSSYALVTFALRKLSLLFPERVPQYLTWTNGVDGVGNEVRVAWHEVRGGRGERSSLQALVIMSGPSYEFRTRVNAMGALQRLNYCDEQLAANLIDAMLNANARLRGPAVGVVQYFLQQSRLRDLFLGLYRSRTWLGWHQDLLAPVLR